MPSRHKSATYALVEELKSSHNVQALKQAEKSNVGEDSVDISLFSKPQVTLKKQAAQEEETKEEVETRKSMEAALMRAEEVNRAKRERLQAQHASLVVKPEVSHMNPYAARSKPAPASVKHGPPTQDAILSAKRVRRSPAKSPSKSDPVMKVLREAERSTFVDGRSGVRQRKIKSNLPHGFTCKICDLPPDKVRELRIMNFGRGLLCSVLLTMLFISFFLLSPALSRQVWAYSMLQVLVAVADQVANVSNLPEGC
jgi:hypothetical protein